MGETLYLYDNLYVNGSDKKSTPQQIKALEFARENLWGIILEKTGAMIGLNEVSKSFGEDIIRSFLKEEFENGTRYLFNQSGGIEKIITSSLLAEVKAFIEQENKTRGGNMTPEECFTMAVCFFKGVQSQQKHSWREVTETDLSKILSEVVAVPAKKRGR